MNDRRKAIFILREVADDHCLTIDQITGKRRFKEVVQARREAQKRIKEETGLSLKAIGRLFNTTHHSVLYHVNDEHRYKRKLQFLTRLKMLEA